MSVASTTSQFRPRADAWQLPIRRGDPSCREVALTFDDGPNDPNSLKIADALDRAGVRGTFFAVAKAVAARPDIVQALAARGHLIGSHAYRHRRSAALVPGYPDLARAQRTLREALGAAPAWFRPPYGFWTPFVLHAASREGLRVVNWDVIAHDWEIRDAEAIAKQVLGRVRGGSIVVLHDGRDGDLVGDRSATAAAVPRILAGLAALGLAPVRLDELLGGPAYLESAEVA